MSLALYRKYRPGTFAELVGQEHITEPLRHALAANRIHHAYLFSGPRGCGKTSSARILARSLNCEQGPTPTPCGICASCVELAPAGPGSIDVIEIDAASHGGVDDARDLRERAFFAPVRDRYKIYIVDEAHMVSREGFNALLKLVEEPPPHLKFVFATTEPEKVIGTIRSRTHHYPFRLMSPTALRELLAGICTAEKIAIEPAALSLVVRAGAGSARDALSVLDQLIAGAGDEGVTYTGAVSLLGYTDAALLDEIVDAFAAGDGATVFETVNRVVDAGHDPRRFTADLLERLRDLVILAAVPDAGDKGLLDVPADSLDRMVAQARQVGQAELSRAADIVNTGLTEMRGATAPRLLLELICARVLLPGAASGAAGALARLDRLERRMDIGGGEVRASGGGVARPVERGAQASGAASEPVVVRPATTEQGGARPVPTEQGGARPDVTRPEGSTRPDAATGPEGSTRPEAATGPEADEPATGPTSAAAPPVAPTSAPERTAPAPAPERSSAPLAPTRPAAGAAAGGSLDTAAVRRVWDQVLESVKTRKRTTYALLSQYAQVVELRGDVLVLSFGTGPVARQFGQGVNEDVLKETLQEFLGVTWRFEIVVAAAGSPTGRSSSFQAASGGTWSAAPSPEEPDSGGRPEAPSHYPDPGAFADTGASEDDEDVDEGATGVDLLRQQLGATIIKDDAGN